MKSQNGHKVRKIRSTTPADQFVRVFQSSGSLEDACESLKAPRLLVLQRANYLRHKGVSLKKFSRGRDWEREVERLNKIVAEVS